MTQPLRLALGAAIAVLAGTVVQTTTEARWPQWRGPGGRGISTEASLPSDWSPTNRVAWKTPLPGRAHSSPVVWGDRIFVTTAIEGEAIPGHAAVPHTVNGQPWRHPDATAGDRRHTLQVIAVEAASGRVAWTRTAYEGPVFDDRHRKSSYAAPTPVTDGRAVYAYFGSEGLYAYDFAGDLKWRAQPGRVAAMGVGVGTSPVLHGDLVIVQADEDNGEASFIAAYHRDTGHEVWRAPRLKLSVSWATPVVVPAGGREYLITVASEEVVAYEPATGREIWREDSFRSNAIPSPVVAGDLVIVSSGYPRKRTIAFKVDAPAGARRVWEYDRGTAYVPSPLVVGNDLYLSADNGLLTCLDARTGEVRYEGGRLPVPATVFSSPVAWGGHLFLTSEDGDTFVIRTGPVHEVVRTNSIGEPVFASLAPAGGTVYIRGERHLFAIR